MPGRVLEAPEAHEWQHMERDSVEELVFHPSILAFADAMLLIAACFFASILICTTVFPLALKAALAATLAAMGTTVAVILFFRARAFTFRLSAGKVAIEYRLFVLRTEELPLEAITSVVVDQTVIERVLRIGKVRVFSLSGRGMTLFGLKQPAKIKDEILRRRELRVRKVTKAPNSRVLEQER